MPVKLFFDRHAARYGHNPLAHWMRRSELVALRDLTPPAPQPGVTPALDFGCGAGRVIGMLLERGYRVTGYDLSSGMLARARVAVGLRPDVTLTADRQVVRGAWPLIVSLKLLLCGGNGAACWPRRGQVREISPPLHRPVIWPGYDSLRTTENTPRRSRLEKRGGGKT